MPVMIQTAGLKTKSRGYLRGPDSPVDSVYIRASTLPNPFGKINLSSCREEENIERVKLFLLKTSGAKLEAMISKGIDAIRKGKPLIIICTHGKHRSRAVAQLIGDKFHPSKVYYVHREG